MYQQGNFGNVHNMYYMYYNISIVLLFIQQIRTTVLVSLQSKFICYVVCKYTAYTIQLLFHLLRQANVVCAISGIGCKSVRLLIECVNSTKTLVQRDRYTLRSSSFDSYRPYFFWALRSGLFYFLKTHTPPNCESFAQFSSYHTIILEQPVKIVHKPHMLIKINISPSFYAG